MTILLDTFYPGGQIWIKEPIFDWQGSKLEIESLIWSQIFSKFQLEIQNLKEDKCISHKLSLDRLRFQDHIISD